MMCERRWLRVLNLEPSSVPIALGRGLDRSGRGMMRRISLGMLMLLRNLSLLREGTG